MELHSLIFESLVERWVESAAVMICTVSQVYSHPLITDLLDQADLVMEITESSRPEALQQLTVYLSAE